MKIFSSVFVLSFLILAGAPSAQAQNAFFEDYLADFGTVSDKLVALAEAVPPDAYSWAPEGARSISEVYVHVASTNFFLSAALGAPMTENIPGDAEQSITEKARVLELLGKSLESVRLAVSSSMDSDLGSEVEAFGRTFTRRGLFQLVSGHIHEHLGQSIAYARMNGITPPWSRSSE